MKNVLIFLCLLPVMSYSIAYDLWQGNDPFHRPYPTTAYWGSGDVNQDGSVNQLDIDSAVSLINLGMFNRFGDVDADNYLTSTDIQILQSGNLPGDWDNLTKAQKISWVSKCLSLTQYHPYLPYYVCGNFAIQFYVNFTGYYNDLSEPYYGTNRFNLPVYPVSLASQGFYHSINAILVGDDPTLVNNWIFIEPQSNSIIIIGMHWSIPCNSTLMLSNIGRIIFGGYATNQAGPLVTFAVNNCVPSIQSIERLDLIKPPTPTTPVCNFTNTYDPSVTNRTDLTFYSYRGKSVDGYNSLWYGPLCYDSGKASTFLHSIKVASTVYVLWKTDAPPNIQLYLTTIDSLSLTVTNRLLVYEYNTPNTSIKQGQVILTSGIPHVFWASQSQVGVKIQTTFYKNGVFSPVLELQQAGDNITLDPAYDNIRKTNQYIFSVCQTPATKSLMLVYINQDCSEWKQPIRYRIFNGTSWGAVTTLDANTRVMGVSVNRVSDTLHLLYWTGKENMGVGDERGYLVHRKYVNNSWKSFRDTIDTESCSINAINNFGVSLNATWEKMNPDSSISIKFGYYKTSGWVTQTLGTSPGFAYQYPKVGRYSDYAKVVWTENLNNRFTVKESIVYLP